MIKITSIFCKYFNFIFVFNIHEKSKWSRRCLPRGLKTNEYKFRPWEIFHLYITFIYGILHILNSYIVYSHLDQVLFMNFRSGKELAELEFKIK